MKKVALYTLGCKVNQYETEAVLETFLQNGFCRTDFSEYSDVYIVNTCTVTGLGDRKSRQILRRAKQKNPNAILVVMGCYAQTAADEIMQIDEVDIILGTKNRNEIFSAVEKFEKERKKQNLVGDIFSEKCFEELSISSFEEKSRAFLKVQDGCNRYCSYCKIPYARGNIRSRDILNAVQEARRLAENGYSEIVLVGIHLASYGKDKKDFTLVDLIHRICQIDGIKRLRLGSLEPTIFTDEFISEIKKEEKLCHHFHISLQSGAKETLKRMNRRYTPEEFFASTEKIRKAMPDSAITTDIICGFPGETEEEFKECCEFVKKIDFADAHIFKYSARSGTKAAAMENQIPSSIKEERSKILIDITKKSHIEYMKKFVGKTEEVLFEQQNHKNKKYIEGKTMTYLSVCADGNDENIGNIKKVKINRLQGEMLFGEIIE